MEMTAKQAKEETLEVWRYLAEHPEIGNKRNLPGEFRWLFRYVNDCPLCEYAKFKNGGVSINLCKDCILVSCNIGGTLWSRWVAASAESWGAAARAIVEKVEKWEVQE
jgi:hypothetical protein